MTNYSAEQAKERVEADKVSTTMKVVVVLLVLTVGFFAPDIVNKLTTKRNFEPLSNYCLFGATPCQKDDVTFFLGVDSIAPLVPQNVVVNWPNTRSDKLFLTMRGYEGELGSVRYTLNRSEGDNFEGAITLPVCTLDEMTWLGEITDGQKAILTGVKMK